MPSPQVLYSLSSLAPHLFLAPCESYQLSMEKKGRDLGGWRVGEMFVGDVKIRDIGEAESKPLVCCVCARVRVRVCNCVCIQGVCCVGVCTMPVLQACVGGCSVCAYVYTSYRDGTWRPYIAV